MTNRCGPDDTGPQRRVTAWERRYWIARVNCFSTVPVSKDLSFDGTA